MSVHHQLLALASDQQILLMDVLAFFQTTGVGHHATHHHPTTRESSQMINRTQAHRSNYSVVTQTIVYTQHNREIFFIKEKEVYSEKEEFKKS